MRIIVFFLISIFSLSLNAWEEQWQQGLKYWNEHNYPAAEDAFNVAITLLEEKQDTEHTSIYIDRAELYNTQGKYPEALQDINKAIASHHLSNYEQMRALMTRMSIASHLKMDELVLADYDSFKAIHPNFPTVEYKYNTITIHNVPDCPCYKKLATALLLASEQCEKESDIKMTSKDVWTIKRKLDSTQFAASSHHKHRKEDIEDCKFWCNKCALIGIDWCVNEFKTYRCQTSCICAVDLIKDRCHWCCRKGHCEDKCVRPFENILFHMDHCCEDHHGCNAHHGCNDHHCNDHRFNDHFNGNRCCDHHHVD